MTNSSTDVVVLGAGPAGLAAAWRTALRGFRVIVLERGDHVGGMAGSFEVAGVRVDHGSHRLHPATSPWLLDDLHGLLGKDLQVRQRLGRVRVADRWIRFPLKPGELVTQLPATLLRGVARDAALAAFRRPREDTYAGVVRAGMGPTLYDAVYGPYAEKLWGLPGDRISAEPGRRRVLAESPGKVIARTLRARRERPEDHSFYYPRHGFGQIPEALADASVAAGVEIRLAAEVAHVRVVADEVQVSTQDGDVVSAQIAFSTLPLPLLARIARPAPPLPDLEAASRLRFRAMLLVYVVHEGGQWTAFDAHYLLGSNTPVTRISEPTNYRDNADDPPDLSVLCVEVPCSMTDEVWGLDDESAGDLVDETLARHDLPPVRRIHVETRRLGQVYPIYRLGFEQDLAGVDAWARTLRRVVTFGRQGLFTHDNTEHAISMAYDAVDAMRDDGSFDRYAWTAARERFHSHVAEE